MAPAIDRSAGMGPGWRGPGGAQMAVQVRTPRREWVWVNWFHPLRVRPDRNFAVKTIQRVVGWACSALEFQGTWMGVV